MAERRLPVDGSKVVAKTYASIEYDRPSQRVVGDLRTRYVQSLSYTQCWVNGVQVDPDTVELADGATEA